MEASNMLSVPQSHLLNQYQPFESIKRIDEDGEHWQARELMSALEYTEWRNFIPVIEKAKTSCKNGGLDPSDHFGSFTSTTQSGKGRIQELEDMKLSRFACYLIAQNGDPRKTVIANAQMYFAMQTRRQEIANKPKSQFQILEQMFTVFAQHQHELEELHQNVAELTERFNDSEYFTVLQWCQKQRLMAIATDTVRRMWGKAATALSAELSIEIKEMPEGRWMVKRYHQSVLAQVCVPKPPLPVQARLLNGGE
jgi:uncharacterized coiled-coil protein SlyX